MPPKVADHSPGKTMLTISTYEHAKTGGGGGGLLLYFYTHRMCTCMNFYMTAQWLKTERASFSSPPKRSSEPPLTQGTHLCSSFSIDGRNVYIPIQAHSFVLRHLTETSNNRRVTMNIEANGLWFLNYTALVFDENPLSFNFLIFISVTKDL